ncbi:MAG: VWA domain-containing protein [Bacteroidales bacterium]|jgi:Tfp pilus assembly protein FimT
MKEFKIRNGFTLIEIVIVISFLVVIFSLAGTMMTFSTKSQAAVEKEFQLQSDMRIASEIVNQELRYSTAVFMLNEHQYGDSSDLKNGWNYFTLSDDKKEIVQYIWDKGTNSHKKISLVKAQNNILFKLIFDGVVTDSRMINFNLDGFYEGSSDSKVSVSSVLNALNAAVVDNSGTPLAPALTLAYRSDEVPDPEKVKIAVTMVLDKSGSMGDPMGGTGSGSSSIRISVMKEKAKKLIDTFADLDNVYVSLISFSTNANNPGAFLRAKDHKTSLKNSIDSLYANGGTNAGDGLRRSYYQHVDFDDPDHEVLHYTILLMDGNPTYWPRKGGTDYYGTGDISQTGGTGTETTSNINNSMDYIESFCNGYIKKTDSSQKVFMKTFVIGFTGISTEVSRAQTIADYHTHSTDSRIKGMYYAATNSNELEEVFKSIVNFILKETWHIYGPIS